MKATSLVHDLKKKQKKDKRETHWGGIKTSSWFKTWNYYKNTTESNRWSVKHLCTVHQEQNHGIHLTEKSVWRWRPYVNCIIVNKLNLVKLSSACLCLMCQLFFYNLCLLAFQVYLLNVDIKRNFVSSRFEVSVSLKSLVARCRHFQNIWLAFIIIHIFHHGISGGVWVLLLKDDQSVWWICPKHTSFFFASNSIKLPDEQTELCTHDRSCGTSAAATTSWRVLAIVQVTLKIINYSQHIRHDWLPSFGLILSSHYLLTCSEGLAGLRWYVAI